MQDYFYLSRPFLMASCVNLFEMFLLVFSSEGAFPANTTPEDLLDDQR